MAFDTKYRPTRYDDVLGQEATVTMLRQFVVSGKGFHQSYLFAGQWGSGKTTLARILARSLLCASPVGGEPCDKCISCLDILANGRSEAFTEFDAASNSGKADLEAIIEENQYSTTSGKQKIYLIDEAHRLSKSALDILLKPMEDERKGSTKDLVCMFCTTEPERMPETVWSRCAPSFIIRVVPPEVIAERLAWVLQQEGIEYEIEALVAIAAAKESHIRDALKAMEAVSIVGPVTLESVRIFLQLNANILVVEVLTNLGGDLVESLKKADELIKIMSPTTVYDRLGEAAMLAFRVAVGAVKPAAYWITGQLEGLGKAQGDFLITFAQCFASRSSRPGHPTGSMLALDLIRLHHLRTGATIVNPEIEMPLPTVAGTAKLPSEGTSTIGASSSAPVTGKVAEVASADSYAPKATTYETTTGRFVDMRGVKPMQQTGDAGESSDDTKQVKPARFRQFLAEYLQELRAPGGSTRRPAGRGELGSPGTNPTGGDPG